MSAITIVLSPSVVTNERGIPLAGPHGPAFCCGHEDNTLFNASELSYCPECKQHMCVDHCCDCPIPGMEEEEAAFLNRSR
jgi:hypothetical protein